MILIGLAFAAPLELSDPGSAHSLVLDPKIDVPIALTAAVAAGTLLVYDRTAKPSVRSQTDFVDPPLIYGEDYQDGVFGSVRFQPSKGWKAFSDVSLLTLPLAALLVPAPDIGRRGGVLRYAGRKLVVFEAVATTVAFTGVGKNAFQRPRPYTLYAPSDEWQGEGKIYTDELYEGCDAAACSFRDRDAFWSFPSGHTSVVTSAVVAWYTTEMLAARGKRRYRWFGLSVPLALGAVVGFARVRAGKHRPSDVTAGWLLGGAIGVLMPLAHDRGIGLTSGPGDAGLAISGRL